MFVEPSLIYYKMNLNNKVDLYGRQELHTLLFALLAEFCSKAVEHKPLGQELIALPKISLLIPFLEVGVGFEPTEPFGPLVFKTSTISQTLSTYPILICLTSLFVFCPG